VSVSAALQDDLAELDLLHLPPDIDSLVAAMQSKGAALEASGNSGAFWSMFKAYERLAEHY
jgi:hypothetical protein